MIERSRKAFEAFKQALAAQGAVLLEDGWKGARTPHWLRCAEGHEVTAYPHYVHRGGGICSKCSGMNSEQAWQEFREAVEAKGGTVLEEHWLTSSVRHRVRCAEGHENPVLPNLVQQGGGICKTCAGCDSGAAQAAFRSFLESRGATLLEPTWLGTKNPHRIQCAKGHLSVPMPLNVSRRGGFCQFCAGNYRGKGAEAFRARLEELGAILLEENWLGAGKPHHARCAAGHDCWPYPNAVKLGSGICITCAGQDKAVAAAEFAERLTALGAVMTEPEYLGANKPHRIICVEGHQTSTYPTGLQRGGGCCRYCANQAWDVFYVVTDPRQFRVKFGITSGNPDGRLIKHRRNGYSDIHLVLPGLPDEVAPSIERAVKAALKLAGLRPVHGKEYFDIVALPVILDIAAGWSGWQAA